MPEGSKLKVFRIFRRITRPNGGDDICEHLAGLTELPEPDTHKCAECVAQGDRWVHLRMCLECGNVGCCDSSKNKHASAHHRGNEHPVMRGVEPGERWVWCYEDGETITLDPVTGPAGPSPDARP